MQEREGKNEIEMYERKVKMKQKGKKGRDIIKQNCRKGKARMKQKCKKGREE